MCGIAGIIDYRNDGLIRPELLQRLGKVLKHRGPDDRGFLGWDGQGPVEVTRDPDRLNRPCVGFVHRRLSVLDLSEKAWQPMGTEDGRYWIVFNGEIYNYLELRKALEREGHRFRSESDTEVLLKAYCQWGKGCLNRLVGMFAFAVLDTRRRSIFLARDFFGIKPLYYSGDKDCFMFASEVGAMLEMPRVRRRINAQGLYDYLYSGVTDHSRETFFADIKQLESAHYVEVHLDGGPFFKPQRYWDVETNRGNPVSFQDASMEVRKRFLQNIHYHLRSDVPVGTALSGGIDSSSIVASVRNLNPQQQLHTFSFVSEDAKTSEEHWIDLAGAASGATIHKVKPSCAELMTDLDALVACQGEPFAGTSIYAQFRVMRLAKEAGIKVMLDGQGADELFAGYGQYLGARLSSMLRQGRPGNGIRFLRQAAMLPDYSAWDLLVYTTAKSMPLRLKDFGRAMVGHPPWLDMAWFKRQGIRCRKNGYDPKGKHLLRCALKHSMATGLQSLLRYEDRNSMAHSIESRVPFLTPELVDYVFSLPEEFLIDNGGTTKNVFRAAMRGIVPDGILNRKDKIGFTTPERSWLTTLHSSVDSLLAGPILRRVPAVNVRQMNIAWRRMLRGNGVKEGVVWRWVNLARWADLFSVEFD